MRLSVVHIDRAFDSREKQHVRAAIRRKLCRARRYVVRMPRPLRLLRRRFLLRVGCEKLLAVVVIMAEGLGLLLLLLLLLLLPGRRVIAIVHQCCFPALPRPELSEPCLEETGSALPDRPH